MHYYIITPPEDTINELLIVNELLKFENVTLHLRKPDYTYQEMSNYIKKIDLELRSKVVIHSHHQLINDFSIKGIHFTQKNKHTLHEYGHLKCSKSISTHSVNEILLLNYHFDYYFLSPIFKSISKPNYGGNTFDFIALETFLKNNNNLKIVALGGVCKENIKQAFNIGFKHVALLGSFWQAMENKDLNAVNQFIETLNYYINNI